MAGVAVGARPLRAQIPGSPEPERLATHAMAFGERSRYVTVTRPTMSNIGQNIFLHGEPDGLDAFTPLRDLVGNITPSDLHYLSSHGSLPPDIDPRHHRLVISGMVKRSLVFTMDELVRLPAMLQSRCTDDKGQVQPTTAEYRRFWRKWISRTIEARFRDELFEAVEPRVDRLEQPVYPSRERVGNRVSVLPAASRGGRECAAGAGGLELRLRSELDPRRATRLPVHDPDVRAARVVDRDVDSNVDPCQVGAPPVRDPDRIASGVGREAARRLPAGAIEVPWYSKAAGFVGKGCVGDRISPSRSVSVATDSSSMGQTGSPVTRSKT